MEMFVSFKYNVDKFRKATDSKPGPTIRITRRSSLNNNQSNHTTTNQEQHMTDHNLRSGSTSNASSVSSTPSKIVTIQYNNSLFSPNLRNRRTTRKLSSSSSSSTSTKQLSIGSTTTTIDSSPIKKPKREEEEEEKRDITKSLNVRLSSIIENMNNYHENYIVSSIQSSKSKDVIQHNQRVDQEWYTGVYQLADSLNFIKEAYRAAQLLKKRKLSTTTTQEDEDIGDGVKNGVLLSSPTKEANDSVSGIYDDDGLDEEDNDEDLEENSGARRRSSSVEVLATAKSEFIPLGKRTRRKVQFKD
ncbi:hypothetical protein G210_5673 [Candida maltosa Xu316]|uniref:Uncharacterized protein n=1 Tax=Candida maltosa (strain Xu316) TaxID=1245528 RepID=M3JBM6_CANMX|nr:hypothetical protein G210_5673 [Candida maltosa Xu316]